MHRLNMKLPAKIRLSLPSGNLRLPKSVLGKPALAKSSYSKAASKPAGKPAFTRPAFNRPSFAKPAMIAGGVAAVVLVVLAVGVPHALDGTRQGQAIAAQLADATGQRVRIEGGVEVSLFPRPHIALNQLKLMAPNSNITVLSAPRVDLNVSYASLLSGSFNVSEVKLVRPVITLMPQEGWAPKFEALSINRVAIEDGTLDIALASPPERITDINGTLHLPAATTLVRTDLKADWRGAPIQLAVDLSPPVGRESAIGYLRLDVGAAEAAVLMVGKLDLLDAERRMDAEIDVTAGQAGSLWALFSSLGMLPVVPIDAGLRQPLSFAARLVGNKDAYDLSAINMSLGNWKVGGLARYVTGENGGLSVALKTDVVDLSLWPTAVDWMQRGSLDVGPQLLGAFDLQMAGVTLGDYRAAPVLLKGDINSGTVKVNEFVAMLPGDARVQFAGSIVTKPNTPAMVDGKLQFEAARLRETITGLGFTAPQGIDDTALRQVKLAADVRGPWGTWSLPTLDATIDGINVTGQMAARPEGGVIDTSFNIDQFDLDKYAQAESLPTWLWQLPPANISVTFRQLRAAAKMASNVTLTASLAPNLLTIKGLDAADFGGNVIRLSGSISPVATQDADLTLRLSTPDFAQLRDSFAPAARLLPAVVGSQISGPVDLSVRYRRSAGELQQLSSATLGEGRIDLVVTQKPEQPTTFKIRLQNRETATVLKQLMPSIVARPDAVLGMLDFYFEGAQQPAGNWQLSGLQGQVAGVTVRSGALTVSNTVPYTVVGNLALTNTNIDLWRQTLQPVMLLSRFNANLDVSVERLTVAGEQLGEVAGQLRLAPPANISVSNLTGKWQQGNITINGQAALAPALMVKGNLDVREADLTLRGGSRFGVSGVADFGVRVEGQGADMAALLHSLAGDGEFSMDSGTFNGIDFAALTEGLQGRRNRNRPRDVDALLARGGESALSTFGGDFEIEDGILKANTLRLRTPSASAEAKVTIDIAGPRLDAQASITLREITGAPPFTMLVAGPTNALEANFDTYALAQFFQPAAPASAVAAADKPAAAATSAQTAQAPATDENGDPVAIPVEQAAAPAAADPAADVAAAREAASAAAAFAIMPPEEPVPPSLDGGSVPMPAATPAELAALSEGSAPSAGAAAPAAAAPAAQAPRQRPTRQRREPAATQRAPRQPAAPAATAAGDAPPSIQDMLAAMPAIQSDVAAAVNEARNEAAAVSSSGGAPKIDFMPVTVNAPTAAPAQRGLAPEFEQRPTPVRDDAKEDNSDSPMVRLPAIDEEGTGGIEPAANVGDLMNRVREE